jgi:hypothetical protein
MTGIEEINAHSRAMEVTTKRVANDKRIILSNLCIMDLGQKACCEKNQSSFEIPMHDLKCLPSFVYFIQDPCHLEIYIGTMGLDIGLPT